jgi:hypothetical protein
MSRYLVFEGYAFGVVFLEPGFRGVGIRENLDMLGVANLLACVDVDKDGHRTFLCAFVSRALGRVLTDINACGKL